VRAASAHGLRGAAGGERNRLLGSLAAPKREGEPGGEAVTGAVSVFERAGQGRRLIRSRAPVERLPGPSLPPGRGDDEPRLGTKVSVRVALALVASAADESVQLDGRLADGGENASGGDEDAGPARQPQGIRVAAHEVHSVGLPELLPRQRIGRQRDKLFADDRDRSFALAVDESEPAALQLVALDGLDVHPEILELLPRVRAELAGAERGVERAAPGHARQLHGGDAASARRLGPPLGRVNDLPGDWEPLHPRELHPLDVPNDGDPHGGSLTSRRGPAFQQKMESVAETKIPPFERFYEERKDEVFGYLARLLGRVAAEDAFQETFLRALRAYPRLEHGRHLRAWIFTIATRVALDERRRQSPAAQPVEVAVTDSRPTYAQLEHLTAALPPTERAAVVLRFGYDLSYDDIGAALGSSADAARQAASSGVRRLRRRNE
jgi:RNA polymerase sigma factor (sigma-70 family)